MARIKDAALFSNGILEDIVEIREQRVKENMNTFMISASRDRDDGDMFDPREGKRNGKRRATRPHGYRGETRVKVFFYNTPSRPMVPLHLRF